MTALTHVEVMWVKDRIENRIRFGPIAEQHVLDRSRQLVSLSGAGDRSGGHLVAAVVELATKAILENHRIHVHSERAAKKLTKMTNSISVTSNGCIRMNSNIIPVPAQGSKW